MIVILFAGTVCGIVFGIKYSQNEKYIHDNNSAIEQVEELKNTIEILTDNNEELQLKFDNLQDSYNENQVLIENYKTQVVSLTEQLTSKESELAEKKEYIEYLEDEKAELESQAVLDKVEIERLNDLLTQANQDKTDLQAEIDQQIITINSLNIDIEALEAENSSLKDTISSLQEQIKNLNSQIFELQNSVTYYLELLEAYENNSDFIVTFVLFDNGKEIVYDVQTVDNGEYLTPVVVPDRADFEGWSLTKGGELIDDLTTIQVTGNMTIYGMCTNTVTFMVNGEEYFSQEVSYNDYAKGNDISIQGYNLEGWSTITDGEIVDLSEINIVEDIKFYAILTKLQLSRFTPKTWNGLSNFNGQYVWTDGDKTYYSNADKQYVLNVETST